MTMQVDTGGAERSLRERGLVKDGDWASGPGLHTLGDGLITVVAEPPWRPSGTCLGVDVGATMTRMHVATTGPDRTATVLKVRYLTGDRVEDLEDQLAEVLVLAHELGLPAVRAARFCLAGPVRRTGRGVAIALTNRSGWSARAADTRLGSLLPGADLALCNDLTVGMRQLPGGRWAPLVYPLTGGTPRPAPAVRLKCHVGTGVNIATQDGDTVRAFEYGHHPFPTQDRAQYRLVAALRHVHGREVITFEDVLGGRALGPMLLAYAADLPERERGALPADTRALLAPPEANPAAPQEGPAELLRTVRAVDDFVRGHSVRYRARGIEGRPELLREAYARFGGWFVAERITSVEWPVLVRLGREWARRFALFVLSAVQSTQCEEAYLSGMPVLDPALRSGFLTEYRRLAGQFPPALGALAEVELYGFAEPAYEDFLVDEAVAWCAERDGAA